MIAWAVEAGMYKKDAERIARKKPAELDEAIFVLVHMDAGRRSKLNNVGGWIVWYIRTKASGQRQQGCGIAAPRSRMGSPYASHFRS